MRGGRHDKHANKATLHSAPFTDAHAPQPSRLAETDRIHPEAIPRAWEGLARSDQ
jgi:hypothetical protein